MSADDPVHREPDQLHAKVYLLSYFSPQEWRERGRWEREKVNKD